MPNTEATYAMPLRKSDLELAAWLAGVASRHPNLEEPTEPLRWPAAARARLERLITQHRNLDRVPGRPRTYAEELRIAASIHELCARHGAGQDLADAIVLWDDDVTWRRRYLNGLAA